MRFLTLLLGFLIGTVSVVSLATAGDRDWAQWRGPARDGHAAEQPLLQDWPEGGPTRVWSADSVGRGYSSLAIADGRVFTLGANETDCFALCLDAKTGKTLWKTEISRAGVGGDYNAGWGAGPRGTPTVDGGQVFAISDIGVAVALDQTTGDLQWSVDLVKQFGGDIPKWGYSESPLIDGDRVIVTPGGDQFMVGLDRRSGDRLWGSQGVSAEAHYVSALKGNLGDIDYYVTAAAIGVVAFDCQTGKKLFENPTTGNGTATIPTPLIAGDQVYHTSNYNAGNVLLQLSAKAGTIDAEQVYHLDGKTMMNHHGGVVLVDGVIYGFTKTNGGVWMAQDLQSGDTLWEQKVARNRSGSICYGDGRLVCYNDEDGSVILVEPSREGWKPHGTLVLPRQTDLSRDKGAIWTHPVIADQTLFIRDQDLIFAFDLRP